MSSRAVASSRAKKLLILAVDRDDDIGVKAGIPTPIVGRENCASAAAKLAIADPEEADSNTIFAAVQQYDELKKKSYDCEVSVVSGVDEEGIEADQKLGGQFRKLSSTLDIDGVVLVTDGINDREILPILQSEVPVISIKRIVVKHSRSVEESYAVLGRYLRMLMYDKRYSKYALGVPGLLLLTLGFLTYFHLEREAFLISIGIVGLAAIVRGFELDHFASSLTRLTPGGYVRLFSSLASVLTILVGLLQGYSVVSITSEYSLVVGDPNLFFTYGSFLLGILLEGAINLVWVGIAINLVGIMLHHRLRHGTAMVRSTAGLTTLLLLYIPIREFSLILSGRGNAITLVSYLLLGLTATFVLVPIIYQYLRGKKKESEGL